jgi:hypothetical protein
MKPNQLTLNKLRSEGYSVAVVEKFIAFPPPGHRVDMFGFADIIAIRSDVQGSLAVNSTTKSNLSFHIKKYLENKNLPVWLKAGNKFFIHAWAKQGPRGERKLWKVHEHEMTIKDFEELHKL